MNNRGNNDFVEEKCAPVRRGAGPPKNVAAPLPIELKPKFPKTEESAVPAELAHTPQTPVEQVPAAQSAIVEAPVVSKTLETEINEAPGEAVVVEAGQQQEGGGSQLQEVPSNDADKADQQQKKKKKAKKPAKKDTGTAVAVFISDDEDKKDDPNNAVGQFVEDDDDDKKKNKKKEKKERIKTLEKDDNKAKDAKGPSKVKKEKLQKTDRGSARQKTKTGQSNRQKRQQGSVRRSAAAKPENATPVATTPQVPTGKNYVPLQNIATTLPQPPPAKDKNKAPSKDATEGLLKSWISKAKQKYVGKNPNIESSTLNGDDSIIAPEQANIKPEITAVYGLPCDYAPKTMPTNKDDKSHPEKLFPGGRPFWMSNNGKPPPAKVITVKDAVDLCTSGKLKFLERQTDAPEDLNPYSEDLQAICAKDKEFFSDYKRIWTNTLYNLNPLPTDAKDRPDPKSTKPVSFKLPTTTTVYKRRVQSEAQKVTTVTFQPTPKGQKMKKKKSSPSNSSATVE